MTWKLSFVPINLLLNTAFNVINVIFCLDGQADKLLFPVLQSLSLGRNKISQVRKCKVFFQFWFDHHPIVFLENNIQWKLDITKGQGTGKIRFGYIQVLFHIFYYFWGEENRLLYQGLCNIEACYIEVPLYIRLALTKMFWSTNAWMTKI